MSVIENNDNIKSGNNAKKETFVVPAVIREEKEVMPLEKAILIALLLHPAVLLILITASFILKFLGIDFNLFNKPDLKPKDIEFVLVEKEAPPIDKNTKNRADRDSRAGGKHDPQRKVSLPQAPAPKAEKPVQRPQPKPQQPKVQPQKVQQPKAEAPKVQKPAPQVQTPAPKAPAPKPNATPALPKPTAKPQSDFNIPIPKSNIPQIAQPTAPVTNAPLGGGAKGSNGSTGGMSSASPSFSPSTSSSAGGGRFNGVSGYGNGNLGNPGPGNPNGAPGIDAIREPDFGPYMKELQRLIKMNWDPPKGNESKRVILLFTIARDGRLLNVNVHRSSGLPAADKAALDAVKLTAPFRPLPPDFRGNSVDIQFTFDYNVFGVSR